MPLTVAVIISAFATVLSLISIAINLIIKRIEVMNALNAFLSSEFSRNVYDRCLKNPDTLESDGGEDEIEVDYAIFYLDFFIPYYHYIRFVSTKKLYDLVAFRFFIVANNNMVRKRLLKIQSSKSYTGSLQKLYELLDKYMKNMPNYEKPFPHYRTYAEWIKEDKEQ